jgi:hypothetical protein
MEDLDRVRNLCGVRLNGGGVMNVQLMICTAKCFQYERNRLRLDESIHRFCNMSKEISSRMHNQNSRKTHVESSNRLELCCLR